MQNLKALLRLRRHLRAPLATQPRPAATEGSPAAPLREACAPDHGARPEHGATLRPAA